MNSKQPITSDSTERSTILNWNVVGKISEGAYGEVFLVKHVVTGAEDVMKRIPKYRNGMRDFSYYKEVGALKALEDVDVVVKLRHHDSSSIPSHRILILEKLDVDLDSLRKRNGSRVFQPSTVYQLVWEMINIAEAIHSRGVYHRDFMLANFMIEYHPEFSTLKVIDFGLSVKSKNALSCNCVNFIEGQFASPNVCQGWSFNSRDEIISIGLLSPYMARGFIPWANMNSQLMLNKKIHFLDNPKLYLIKEAQYIIPIIDGVKNFFGGLAGNYDKLRQLISDEYTKIAQKAVSNKFNVLQINGKLRLK